jgi:iron(III) transport system permease protein
MRLQRTREELILQGLMAAIGCWMLVVVVFPLLQLVLRSVSDSSGALVGLSNYRHFLRSPALLATIGRTLNVSLWTSLLAMGLGFVYAYALVRTPLRGKGFLRAVAMAPLFTPSMMHGIALIYLFGNKGVVTTGLFGLLPGIDIGLYGATGIVMAEVLYAFPQVVMILSVALATSDGRLYDAAASLGASRLRTFFAITLPGIKYGLISAFVVCFTLAFTDFGAPKVVGGQYAVLAVEVYKSVVGQQDFVMGAVISVVMLLPTLLAFGVEQLLNRAHAAHHSSRSSARKAAGSSLTTSFLSAAALLIAGAIVVVYATVALASLTKLWPYKLSLTLANYDFRSVGGGGFGGYGSTVGIALLTALGGTVLVFGAAWLVERMKMAPLLRRFLYLASLFPLALPGTVIGIAYIFFFNSPQFSLPFLGTVANPFAGLYGTLLLVVIVNIVHFMPVAFITATTALKKLDHEFEAASRSMGVPLVYLLGSVIVPLCLPALIEIALYFFINAMITVSAVIFLHPSGMQLASIAVVSMEEAGDTAAAAAMAMLILLTNGAARALYALLHKCMHRRDNAQRRVIEQR